MFFYDGNDFKQSFPGPKIGKFYKNGMVKVKIEWSIVLVYS